MPWTVLSVWMQSNTCTLMVGVVFKQVILIHGLFESCTYLPFCLPAPSVTRSSVLNAQLIIFFWVPSCLAHWVVALCHQMQTQFGSLYPLDESTFLVSMKCLCFPWQNSLSWDPSSHYRFLLMNLCICTNFYLFIFSTLLKLHGLGFLFFSTHSHPIPFTDLQ